MYYILNTFFKPYKYIRIKLTLKQLSATITMKLCFYL